MLILRAAARPALSLADPTARDLSVVAPAVGPTDGAARTAQEALRRLADSIVVPPLDPRPGRARVLEHVLALQDRR